MELRKLLNPLRQNLSPRLINLNLSSRILVFHREPYNCQRCVFALILNNDPRCILVVEEMNSNYSCEGKLSEGMTTSIRFYCSRFLLKASQTSSIHFS